MSCLPFNLTSFRFDNASTWLSVQVTFAHLPHLSHQHCYLILYQIGYWISASGFTLGLELAIRQDGFAFSRVNLRKGLGMSCGGYINLGPRGCGSYMKKQGNGQEIMTVSREGRSLAGQTWRVRNSEKQLQVGSLLNALCPGERLCVHLSADGGYSEHPFSCRPKRVRGWARTSWKNSPGWSLGLACVSPLFPALLRL